MKCEDFWKLVERMDGIGFSNCTSAEQVAIFEHTMLCDCVPVIDCAENARFVAKGTLEGKLRMMSGKHDANCFVCEKKHAATMAPEVQLQACAAYERAMKDDECREAILRGSSGVK